MNHRLVLPSNYEAPIREALNANPNNAILFSINSFGIDTDESSDTFNQLILDVDALPIHLFHLGVSVGALVLQEEVEKKTKRSLKIALLKENQEAYDMGLFDRATYERNMIEINKKK